MKTEMDIVEGQFKTIYLSLILLSRYSKSK